VRPADGAPADGASADGATAAVPAPRPTSDAGVGADGTGTATDAPRPETAPPGAEESAPVGPPLTTDPHPVPGPRFTPEELRTLASWDRDLDALTGELRRARATVHDVPVPPSLSASQLLRLAADPDGFAHELARPMPRPPQPAARRGTRFHAWVESRFEELPLPMLGPDELPGGEEDEPEIADERDLAALKTAFERTPYARRTPYRVEAPFHLTLAGRVIRGRIDAVYRHARTDPVTGAETYTYEIVDWKTSRARTADPLQLAVYRLAWAEQHGLPPSAVTAAFLYVRTGEVVRPEHLPSRPELERILTGGPPGAEESYDDAGRAPDGTGRSYEDADMPTDGGSPEPADETAPRAR
ncbi:PD-(D/E)XK nuclease family protein, partial [Streptomyces sp. NPDC088341]|uniref:PD-(D/E)XK nuclease family protein n=1 Tax=Streptomyces sp. NPDC088341 TaxID=3154870 RepID=UPI003435E0D0